MGINVNDYEAERKMKRAISKFPSTIRPTDKQFIAAAVNTYIDVEERHDVN